MEMIFKHFLKAIKSVPVSRKVYYSYFLSSGGQKIKNITKIVFIFYGASHAETDLHSKHVI